MPYLAWPAGAGHHHQPRQARPGQARQAGQVEEERGQLFLGPARAVKSSPWHATTRHAPTNLLSCPTLNSSSSFCDFCTLHITAGWAGARESGGTGSGKFMSLDKKIYSTLLTQTSRDMCKQACILGTSISWRAGEPEPRLARLGGATYTYAMSRVHKASGYGARTLKQEDEQNGRKTSGSTQPFWSMVVGGDPLAGPLGVLEQFRGVGMCVPSARHSCLG